MTTNYPMCPNFPHGPRDCGGVARQAGSDYTCTFCFEQRKGHESARNNPMITDTALIPAQDRPQPAVTLVTAFSQAADLCDAEYRVIFDQVADGRSLRNIELALRSTVSFAWWGKYAIGEKILDLDRRNELRIWAGLPELPPTPAAAVAAGAHPDAAVYQVGTQIASRIVLVGADVPAVNLRVNGNCTVVDAPAAALPYTPHVTGVTGHRRRAPRKSVHLSLATWNRLNSARQRAQLSWDAFLALLASGGAA